MYISQAIKDRFTKAEFWALTAISTISILIFTSEAIGLYSPNRFPETSDLFQKEGLNFGYYKHYFLPHSIRYLSYFILFMWLNFKLIPMLIADEKAKTTIAKMVLCFVAILAVNVFSDYYLKAYLFSSMGEEKAFAYFWQSNLIYSLWLVFAFVTYSLFKYAALLTLSFFEKNPPKMAFLDQNQMLVWAMVLQMSLVLLFFTNAESFLIWISVCTSLILIYNLAFYKWIPLALEKRRMLWQYMWRIALFATAASFASAFIIVGPTDNEDFGFGAAILQWFFIMLIAAPAIWFWYHYQQKRKANINVLQQKLGQSTAQLDQLRAQINPHFLFNALNTVYGLALTEKADQTADAIEKISEMMRFMLRENQEDSIPLEKDFDYLKNYMRIQEMRLGPNPNIDLRIDIPEQNNPALNIAPMLLIPFVENAFKHGISLQSASYIHLAIRLEDNQLFFTLQNSIHDRMWLNDPEKNNHGIGLNNVKQRLALLYPEKHLLDIKEDAENFKINLTLLL